MEAENPFDEIRSDEKIKKYNGMVKRAKFQIDSSLKDELQQYIIFAKPGRKSFEPNSAEDLRVLIREMEETQAYRDRVTGIQIQAKAIIDELDILKRSGEAHIYAVHGDKLKGATNKEKRDAAVHYIMGPVMRMQEQWKTLKEIADIAKQNLNETYFALREIGENGRTILADRQTKKAFD